MKSKAVVALAKVGKRFGKSAPGILTGAAVIGVVATAYLVYKATPKIQDVLEEKKLELETVGPDEKDAKLAIRREAVKELIPVMAPPVISGGLTIGSILLAHRASSRQLAAALAAYDISRNAYNDLKDKTKEVVGEKKAAFIQEEIARDKYREATEKNVEVVETGKGEVIFLDELSGRKFKSHPEVVKKIINDLNFKLIDEMYVSLNDLYYELGLRPTKLGRDLGWNLDSGKIYIEMVPASDEDDIPYIVLEYSVTPRYRYDKLL